ncbi:hypothetical protein BH10PSE16_BH10PSE16_42430 [soil metagenome]
MMQENSQDILDALQENCPYFGGAVIATPDGLVLVATTLFSGDTPAACAAGLVVQVNDCLSALKAGRVDELMMWTLGGLWFIGRLVNDHVLLLSATNSHCAGAVRLAAQVAVQRLNAVLH